MAELLPGPPPLATTKAPNVEVSPAAIAQPYRELADTLDKTSGALETTAENLAQNAGMKAGSMVTRGPDGSVQLEKAPIIGPASPSYERAMKVGALAQGEADAKQTDIRLRQQFRDDPEGYLREANAAADTTQQQYADAGAPEVGIALKRAMGATATFTYRSLLSEKERLDLQRAEQSISAGVDSASDDAMALARKGVSINDPAMASAIDKYVTLQNERASNPRLVYTPEQQKLDFETFQSRLGANRFLYHNDEVYKAGGFRAAEEDAKSVLTDPAYKLSQQERESFYHKAIGEIRANESIRRQDVGEARAAYNELSLASATGQTIDPDQVETVARAAKAAGDPGLAARVYASFARKSLNDSFGQQPLSDQFRQLDALKGAAQYRPLIEGAAQKYGLDPATFARQLYQENGFRATGVSSAGARGIAQFMPETAARYGVNPDQPESAIPGAARYMADLKSMFGGNTGLALAGYNWGENHVAQWLASGANPAAMPAETRNYVRNITGQSISDWTAGKQPEMAAAPGGLAASAWLTANRQRTIDTELWGTWKDAMKDYSEKGFRPSAETLSTVIDGARSTGNSALLEQVGHDMARVDLAQNAAQQPLPDQHAAITAWNAAGQEGTLPPGNAAVLKDLTARNKAIIEGLNENPIATAVTNFPDKFKTPPPLNLQDPAELAAGLGMRARIAKVAAQNWQTGPLSALDKSDVTQVQAALNTADPAAKMQIFSAFATLPEDVRAATLKKVGGNQPAGMVDVAAGSLIHDAPEIAQSIFRGQQAIKADKGYLPSGDSEKRIFSDDLDQRLPAGAFSLASRTDPTGAYAVMRGAVQARYADLSAQAADTTGKLDSNRLQQAVDDVTGGVLNFNGGSLIAPQRGMSQPRFDSIMWGINDSDLAGVTDLHGRPVTAGTLRSYGKLESVGDGRYAVRFEGGAYAYTGANTEMPQKYVIDLRNRPIGTAPLSNYTIQGGMD